MVGGSFDYLLNISSLTFGYNEQRRFELLGIAGVEVGYSRANDNSAGDNPAVKNGHEFYYGVRMGLQGNIRLSRTLDLFVEPESDGTTMDWGIRKVGETIKWEDRSWWV